MRVLRFLGYSVLVILVLLVGAAGAMWYFNPFAPPVLVSDPGPGGRRVTDNGLVANYYPASGDGKHPAILLLGGSEGGIGPGVTRMATALHEKHFAVLNISYFRAPGQTERLALVPLETFDRAIDWLKAQPDVDADRLAIVGGSKGAEAALIVATRHPELRAVVAGMPSSVAWQGVDWNMMNYFVNPPGGSWALEGKPIPFVPYVKKFTNSLLELYAESLAQLPDHQDAIIPIEASHASVLLICGRDDSLWPSCPMAEQVKARAESHQGPAVVVLAYDHAGHGVFGVPLEKTNPNFNTLASLGGTADGNNAARIHGWPKVLEHLSAALK
jgi:dienelactone hydrolase